MIFNDFDAVMNEKLDSGIRQTIINKYKIEAVYYAVIEETLKRYGIAPPPPEEGANDKRRQSTRIALDGRNIANMDIEVLGCARDQMAMRLSDLYNNTNGSRGVGYDKIRVNGKARKEAGLGPYDDITVVRGKGLNGAGALDPESLKSIAADAFMNCEPLYQMIQTHLASEIFKTRSMTDEELAAETDAEMRRMLDPNIPNSVMSSVYDAIESMSDDSCASSYTKYSMRGKIKDNQIRRIYNNKIIKTRDDIEIDAAGFKAVSECKDPAVTDLVKKGLNYVEFRSPEKNFEYGNRTAAMIKISPLMPEAHALLDAGAFSKTFGRNGFLMFDTERNMLVPAPIDDEAYNKYASISDADLDMAIDGDDPFILGPAAATGESYVNYKKSHTYDDSGYDSGEKITVKAGTAIDDMNASRYETANTGFKARMIELLEKYSIRDLNESDVEAINAIFDHAGAGSTIFGSDWDDITRNSDAYFGYIEHVCSQAANHISSHEFEIHFEIPRTGGFTPIMYITGERTDNYITAKSNAARFIAIYPYTDYYSGVSGSKGPSNPDVCAMAGDIELPSRDGYRIVNVKAHDTVNPDNPYSHGIIDAGMVADMKSTFDAYIVGETQVSGEIEMRKISRARGENVPFDAADFVDEYGNIRYTAIRNKLAWDRNVTKNSQRNMFEANIDDNAKRFDDALEEFAENELEGGDVWAAVSKIFEGRTEDPDEARGARKEIAEKLATCALHAVRDSLDDDRNNFTVRRHIFMNYAAAYADRCMEIMTSDMGDDEKREAITAMNPIRDDVSGRGGKARPMLNKSLDELFGYDYVHKGQPRCIIKANMCKYMSTQISSYDDYDKLLALLSHSGKAEYEPDKLKEINGWNSGDADITIQLFSSEAYDASRAGDLDDDDVDDDRSGAGTDYGASFDDDIKYAGMFAETSENDYSYASIIGKSDKNMAIFRATHPLQYAALEKTADIIKSHEGTFNPDGLKITPQGIIYYDPENDNDLSFKIGPVLDEKAYIRPIMNKIADYDPEQPEYPDKSIVGVRLAEIPKSDSNGNHIYDANGIKITEKAWITVDYDIKINSNGEVENPISFGALDTEHLIGGNGAMNRFYGISARIGNYDGYGHEGQHYAERAKFGTYGMGVLENLSRQLTMRYIAKNTSDPKTEGLDTDDEAARNQNEKMSHNRRMARAAAYCEVGGGTLMKCYHTNTYILGDKTACRMADAYMSEYRGTMADAAANIPESASELSPDSFARKFYDAVKSADMNSIDEIFAECVKRSANKDSWQAMEEMFGEDNAFRIQQSMTLISTLYNNIGGNSWDDPIARRKYRENANLVSAQSKMNWKRSVAGKITLDQNIGLKEQANNIQQALKGELQGKLDRKSMRNTDALSARVAVFETNKRFDPEYSATAKQLGAVMFLADNVNINRLTGEISDNDIFSRCVLATEGVTDFATGAIDCRYVTYPGGKALDRSQLAMNAVEKSLGYAKLRMAMASAWYNMEDGYIISKRAASELGHFDANGGYIPAKPYDKIGDSESGNKGIISKIVDTDIEDENSLKAKLAREYIQNRRVNGKPVIDGPEDDYLNGLIRRYNNRSDRYGDPDAEWDDRRIIEAGRRHDDNLEVLYTVAYDKLMTSSIEQDERPAVMMFAIEMQIAGHPQDKAAKAAFMRDFISRYENDTENGKGLRELLDESIAVLCDGEHKIINADGSMEIYENEPGITFESVKARIDGVYETMVDNIEREDENLIADIADYMSERGMQPWSGHYKHEKFLWRLFKENDGLDVLVTDACVNTRSNPSLIMYIVDDENNALTVNGTKYDNASGTIVVYLDSHLGDEKNTDYTGRSNKQGRAIGAQEMYMMNAKNADGAFMKWIMLNDQTLSKNIARYNRKLMMNGFIADVNNGMRYTYLRDIINDTELENVIENKALAYKSDKIPGTAFIDMEELARPIIKKLFSHGRGRVGDLKDAVTDMANDLNFTRMFDIANGKINDKNRKKLYKNGVRTMESEDGIRNIFADAFGSSGGNFMLLPEGISDTKAIAYHNDRPRRDDINDEYDGVPIGINGDDYDISGGGFDVISAYESGSGYESGYGRTGNERDGKFKVDMHADVIAGGRTRRAVPLFMSSYESIDDDTETVTSKTDDRLQLDIFKRAFGCALIDAIEAENDKNNNGKDGLIKELAEACENARSKLASELSKKYESISEGRSKTLDLSNKMAHYLKKKLYRMSFPKSLTCVWHGDPNINIDEAGLSFESAKKLGYLRPLKGKDQPLTAAELKGIPDDYEHMHLRYYPVGNNDFVWVNRSPGQTTGCARMLRLRITGQSEKGLAIHPAVATIYDGDFDGDTVGTANPMHVVKGSALEAYLDKNPNFMSEVINEIKSSMTMEANLVKTADYTDININGESIRTYPLFIAGNADVAIACANMKNNGIDIDKELERITVAANIAEQAKQILNDGCRGDGRQIENIDVNAIRGERRGLLSGYGKYIDNDRETGGEWQEIYDTAKRLIAAAMDEKYDTITKVGDERASEAIARIEKACMGRLRKAYSDMEGYVSEKPCFTHGRSALDMACNKVEDANINKKGKDRQLNALMLFGGMHANCVRHQLNNNPDLSLNADTCAYGLDVIQGPDKKYAVRVKEFNINNGKAEERDACILRHDENGRLRAYDAKTGDEIPGGEELIKNIENNIRWDNMKARSDTPISNYRSESELNASAQACKSDGTGIGGAVAQKFQMMLSAYGYGELGLRISGPITQKYLDAKQNVTMCSKNLKIGKAALDAVCKFQYVREFSSEYNKPDADNKKPEPGQVYNGHFTQDPTRRLTIGEGVEQLSNLLNAIGQPPLTSMDKKIISACVHAMQADYDEYLGVEPPEPDEASPQYDHSDEKLRYNMKEMYAAIGDAAYSDMYAVKDGMHGRKIADEADRISAGKNVLKNSVFKPDLESLKLQLSDISRTGKFAARYGDSQAENESSGRDPENSEKPDTHVENSGVKTASPVSAEKSERPRKPETKNNNDDDDKNKDEEWANIRMAGL